MNSVACTSWNAWPFNWTLKAYDEGHVIRNRVYWILYAAYT